MLPIYSYKDVARKPGRNPRENNRVNLAGKIMEYQDVVDALTQERDLLNELVQYLQEEIESVISGDVGRLEDSMPKKKRILDTIASNRSKVDVFAAMKNEERDDTMRKLQREIAKLWQFASGLNETSKDLVSKRLEDIDLQLEPFFLRHKQGYDRTGKICTSAGHTIKAGA